MKNANIAFLISDKKHNIAVISGVNDNEDSWTESPDGFINNNINNISLNITEDTHDYSILMRDDFTVKIASSDLQTELSESVKLNSLIDVLLVEEEIDIQKKDNKECEIKFNIADTDITIYKKTINLMRGKREFLHIVL